MNKILAALSVLLLSMNSVHAGLSGPSIHGFLTAGATRGSVPNAYDGWITDKVSFVPSSRVGVTLYQTLDDQWSATVQWVGRAPQPNFFQEIDWAVLGWQPVDRLLVRVGKQQLPTWLISDYREIGYLYPWVRAPGEVYFLNPVSSYIGLYAKYVIPIVGNWKLNASGLAGGFSADVQLNSTQKFSGTGNDLVGLMAEFTNGKLLFRASHFRSTLAIDMLTSSDSANPSPLAPAGSKIRSTVVIPLRGSQSFTSLGTRMDIANFLIFGEYAAILGEDPIRSFADSAYGTIGYYLFNRTLLPHFTHAANLTLTSNMGDNRQFSDTFGLNYFVSDKVVLKVDWQRVQVVSGTGLYTSTPASNINNIFDLALSMVF